MRHEMGLPHPLLKALEDLNKIKLIVSEMVSAFKSRSKVKTPTGWS